MKETHNQLLKRLGLIKFKFKDDSSGYSEQSKFWKAETLYKAVRDQKVTVRSYDLSYFNYSNSIWDLGSFSYTLSHFQRILDADINIPIIVSHKGQILDGYHRIAKQLLINKEKMIPCYFLEKMPDHDEECINDKWVKV